MSDLERRHYTYFTSPTIVSAAKAKSTASLGD